MKPIDPGLLTGLPSKPSLLGSRCTACGEHFFPVQKGCANCSSDDLQTVDLGSRGTLWTWTVQRFAPKPPYLGDPNSFEAYGVGYVEMPSGVKVESRLLGLGEDDWTIGMAMQLELEPVVVQGGATDLVTYAFRALRKECCND
ncbi:Zn-ribbon domain-containing OB-fold protein [Parahaliea maris]|nr:OB-fold domain-containing protein [Parahaliea maris]